MSTRHEQENQRPSVDTCAMLPALGLLSLSDRPVPLMALPNLGTLSLGPASTAAEVPCWHFGKPVSEEKELEEKELELVFERFKKMQERREEIEPCEEPPGKRVSNQESILTNLDRPVQDDTDTDMLFATSLALGYQREVGDSWSKTFDDNVLCPESWTTPGPASIIRMRNYKWCYPDKKLDNDRTQSYMLKASLFLELTWQRRQNTNRKTFPEAYINIFTMQTFYGTDTKDILTRFLAECSDLTQNPETTRTLYENDTFPPARATDEDASDDDDEEGGITRHRAIFDIYYSQRNWLPILLLSEMEFLTISAKLVWNVPWEKRLGVLGRGRITGGVYTFWTADEYETISTHIHNLEYPAAWPALRLQDDAVGNTAYTDGELAFKGPNTMNYPDLHPDRSLYSRHSHPDFDYLLLDSAPPDQSAIDCLDISVHVPIEERVNLNDRERCKIYTGSLAAPGTGRDAIVIVRPSSYYWGGIYDNEPLHTDVFAANPPNEPQTRENIFLQWLQQNELRRWGVARTDDESVDGWYTGFRDSYEFRRNSNPNPNPNPNPNQEEGEEGGEGEEGEEGEEDDASFEEEDDSEDDSDDDSCGAVAKVPGANMRDVMVTDGDFYNAEVGHVLPSSLCDLSSVHKVPQGLAFFVEVSNVDDQDPCRYVEAVMNECLRRGREGEDHGCIAWLLDEMGKTPGYEAMAKAQVLYSDDHWVSQSTHTESTMTPYERQTGIKLTDFKSAPDFDPPEGPAHSGGMQTPRFTAGCKLGFGLSPSDHRALHGGDGRATARRRLGVETARAALRDDWTAARSAVVDI